MDYSPFMGGLAWHRLNCPLPRSCNTAFCKRARRETIIRQDAPWIRRARPLWSAAFESRSWLIPTQNDLFHSSFTSLEDLSFYLLL